MSFPISDLIDSAARRFADPNKTRVKQEEWFGIYLESVRELCEKADVYKVTATFNLFSGSDPTDPRYPYPERMTQMTAVEVTESPTNRDSYKKLREIFEGEFWSDVYGNYPSGALPDRYFADQGWLWLVPRPTVSIAAGGRLTYFGVPANASDWTQNFPLMYSARDYVVRRMVIAAKVMRNRLVEAQADLALWTSDVEGMFDRIEDRSKDRRSTFRPLRRPYAGMR